LAASPGISGDNGSGAMKNPWMSAWLSAANKAAGTSRAFWLAETRRQQASFTKDVARAWGLDADRKRKPRPKRKGS
jgi:hypothetical protein